MDCNWLTVWNNTEYSVDIPSLITSGPAYTPRVKQYVRRNQLVGRQTCLTAPVALDHIRNAAQLSQAQLWFHVSFQSFT